MFGTGYRPVDIRPLASALIAVAALLGAATQATGEGLLFREHLHSMLPVDTDFTASIALADVDGDGDLDALLGNGLSYWPDGAQQNRLYLNDGNGVFTDATAQIPADTDVTRAVALGDVDGDGDLDAFLGNHGSQNRLYLNDGYGFFTDATAQLPIVEDATLALALGDVDGDGDLDAYIANTDGREDCLYLNDGEGVFTEAAEPIPWGGSTVAVALGDVDGDGDLDVLLATYRDAYPNQTLLLLNDGNGTFTNASNQIPGDAGARAVALGDVDADGDLDAFVGHTDYQNRLFLNDGTGIFTDASVQIPVEGDATSSVAFGDVDGDGDLDVFLGNNGGQNSLYLNDGTGVFTDASDQIPEDGDHTVPIALGDVDGDGDLDALLGNGNYFLLAFDPENHLYLNDGNGVFTDTADATLQIPADLDWTRAVALGDVDGDGDLDALLGNRYQNRLYLNDGTGVFTDATAQIPVDESYTNAVALGDVDGDGDLDAFLGNATPYRQNRVYLNDGNGVFVDATSHIPVDLHRTFAVALGDVDEDGDLDAFIGNGSGDDNEPNRLILNDGFGFFNDATSQIPPDVDGTAAIALGDVDGDGDLDAFVGNYGQNRLYLNDGTGIFTDATAQIPMDGDATSAVALGDVDGDGDLDAFLGNHYNGNRLYLNDGAGVFTNATSQIPADSDRTFAVALGDVDLDGDLDAFIGNGYPTNQNRLYLNDGYGVFTDATSQIQAYEDVTAAVTLGDLDGDGDLDVFLGNLLWGDHVSAKNRLCNNFTRQLCWRGIPRIGKPLDLDLHGPADGTYILGISRHETYRPKPPKGVLRIHPGYILHTTEGTLDSDGHALLTYNIPDDPALVGKSYYWQALVRSPGRFTNLEITAFTDL